MTAARGRHAGQRAEPLPEPPVRVRERRGVGVAPPGQRELEREDVRRIEPGRHVEQRARSCESSSPAPTSSTTASASSAVTSRRRRLPPLAHTLCAPADPRPASREIGLQIDARQPQRRHQPEQQPGDAARRQREHQHFAVERDLVEARHAGLAERADPREAPVRERHRARRPHQRQERALGEQLTDDAAAARTERRAHGHLVLPRHAPRQQQVGDVRARDEQHEADRSPQARAAPAARRRPPVRAAARR